jgi:hypothetical protein
MSRHLIVAHDTATSPTLIERVQEVARNEPGAEFVLLVPATPVAELQLLRSLAHDATTTAKDQAERARRAFAAAGVELLDARIGAADPLEAIADEVRRSPGYGAFIISSLPEEHSRWLRGDLPRRVEQEYGLPVIRVELAPTTFEFWRRRGGWGRAV